MFSRPCNVRCTKVQVVQFDVLVVLIMIEIFYRVLHNLICTYSKRINHQTTYPYFSSALHSYQILLSYGIPNLSISASSSLWLGLTVVLFSNYSLIIIYLNPDTLTQKLCEYEQALCGHLRNDLTNRTRNPRSEFFRLAKKLECGQCSHFPDFVTRVVLISSNYV